MRGAAFTDTNGDGDRHAPPWRYSTLRFYAELNDFLPAAQRQRRLPYRFSGTPAIKDAIQAVGVPHTEVDLIIVAGQSWPFSRRLHGGEQVAVYPVFECFDIGRVQRLRPRPLRQTKFALDVHLGKLARWLRLCGFDSAYRNDWRDADLIAFARQQHRILLTRDRGILFCNDVTHAYYVRATDVNEQIREVLHALQLERQLQPFTRCLHCNDKLRKPHDTTPPPTIPAAVLAQQHEFAHCRRCQRWYWPGSHFQALHGKLQRLLPL